MKNLLVLTDFSANADHAAHWALALAKQLHTGIVLFHTVQSIPIMPNYTGGGFVNQTDQLFVEESQEQLNKLKGRLLDGGKSGISIEIRYGEGDLGGNVEQLLRERDIELIVMGAPASSLVDHLLTGSATRSVIKSTDRPVLVIPVGKQVQSVTNFVLATDYRSADLSALRYLINWVDHNGGRLDVVHIQTPNKVVLPHVEQKQVFELFLANLNHSRVQCHDLLGKAVIERLNRFCADKKVDVLAMTNYHHDFFSHLFGTSETFKALQHLQLPVLVFPDRFIDGVISTQ